jgi:large subunit ribosomal protein L3
MPGHMGNKFRTILNLEVIKSDLNNDLIYLKGSIPGSKNTLVFLKNSVKNINKKIISEKYKIIEKKDTKPVIANAKENKISSKDIKKQAT